MKILITGTTSGLGKYLAENIECDTFNRDCPIPDKFYDVIINCAYDHKSENELEDNINLIERILTIPCGYLLHMSSIDVYRPESSLYAYTKLEIERLIRSSFDNYCILRLGKLVGSYMRRDNLVKMFTGEQMSLSPESSFCLMSYENLLEYIDTNFIESVASGLTMNFGSKRVTLKEIANTFGLDPKWGEYTYISPDVGAGKVGFTDYEQIIELAK